ncbi:MAG: hypothetical protein CVU56_12540, partial [Deltaproteobacteria bacterium HGW-Deltaproteobacteria-14]
MSNNTQLGRRSFLGVGAAAVAGAGFAGLVVGATRGASARFSLREGFPDCPVVVTATLPGAADGTRGQAKLFVVTPTETLVYELGPVRVERGEAKVHVALVYPYEDRVPGLYAYHVQIEAGG